MLVSPGLEITVIDESQYVSTAVGTVPFLLVATQQNKVYNGSIAPYTTQDNAGKLLAVTSQRDLITNFGYPVFNLSAAGTPLHGDELNEYGIMAAYSALGVVNRMFIIRADIDLAQLKGTEVRPIGDPANGTYWLDLTNTAWGINEWNATTQSFTARTPILITDASTLTVIGGIPTPNSNIGTIGTYAVVVSNPNNYVFYKGNDNVWVQVGSPEWQMNFPAVVGTTATPIIDGGLVNTMIINGNGITLTGTSVLTTVNDINAANIPGVTAGMVSNKLALFVTSAAMSNGSVADGMVLIQEGSNAPAAALGLMPIVAGTPATTATYGTPVIEYGTYIQIPDWRELDVTPRPSGSVWVKTSVLGSGTDFVIKMYDANNDVWVPIVTPLYGSDDAAVYGLDPNNGGFGIESQTVYIQYDTLNNGSVSYRPYIRQTQGAMSVTGTAPVSPMIFTVGDQFRLIATLTGTDTLSDSTITLNGTNPEDFVTAILAANIPDVNAYVEPSGAITLTHRQGGSIQVGNIQGTPLTTAGYTTLTDGVRAVPNTNLLLASNFAPLLYTYSASRPYQAPADGTLWFYKNALDVDIMVNDTTGWKGYRNVSRDARGFNLVNTDPAGPIMAPLAPTTQSDNTALVPGDLWIDTGDLVNFPVISRWTGVKWQLVDNTDVITQNGIVFADVRWDATIDQSTGQSIGGLIDPAAGGYPEITDMLVSDYIDLDAPDHRLYPRGTLLFNLRRSGFNVKHYVSNFFNENSYPNETLPTQTATWVTSSGLRNDGSPYMGASAQRNMVVKAMRAAIDTNETVREDRFGFNLLATPGYPELTANMSSLNADRKYTGFIIADTPMTLKANVIDINNWSDNTNGDGGTPADPYIGVYYPCGMANDLQGNTIVVPPSHMILRAAIKSDNVSYPWFTFAGTRRGVIDNATDLGYINSQTGAFVRSAINQGLRDALYLTRINPITILPGIGMVNFGNKTRNGYASSMDRVNVARLVNYMRTILAHVGDGFLFEPNDAITRNQIRQVISSAINDLIAKRGVYDYLVICDETNNDNGRVARNELYVDVAIEPMKDVEFIYIPIRLKNPGDIKSGGK